jgi:hypothetical protein
MAESSPEEKPAEAAQGSCADGAGEKRLNTGKKRGRPPKPGSEKDLERQLDKLRGMAHLPPEEFKLEAQRHIQGLLGLVTGKLYERIDDLSPTNLSVLYGILMDKHQASAPAPQNLSLTQITVNGVDRGSMRELLGKGRLKELGKTNTASASESIPYQPSRVSNLPADAIDIPSEPVT